ncbi:uncharacterized protein LOC133381127 isoform X5 [Rhineura floridana]|uniref:uncharacterized protein LOC133375375 isoform X5 n=1 Tax=Rhineura floridana TaxID=261503 RepID=UPI002AC80F99|nr:uncharacterized protein LOC133375375 isoform X5 [Rhineura floridana]XP_061475707.1 uncharacterized protein LOC133381127 isoform X5 [Rhineura floridana]
MIKGDSTSSCVLLSEVCNLALIELVVKVDPQQFRILLFRVDGQDGSISKATACFTMQSGCFTVGGHLIISKQTSDLLVKVDPRQFRILLFRVDGQDGSISKATACFTMQSGCFTVGGHLIISKQTSDLLVKVDPRQFRILLFRVDGQDGSISKATACFTMQSGCFTVGGHLIISKQTSDLLVKVDPRQFRILLFRVDGQDGSISKATACFTMQSGCFTVGGHLIISKQTSDLLEVLLLSRPRSG